jgi:hypothetical protein
LQRGCNIVASVASAGPVAQHAAGQEVEMRGWWVAIGLAAGCGGVREGAGAPFDIGGIKAALFSIGDTGSETDEEALIVLSTSDLVNCDDFAGASINTVLQRVAADGSGLVFQLVQARDADQPTKGWTGTWTSDGAFVPSEDGGYYTGSRFMQVVGFTGGMLYFTDYSDPGITWVTVDRFDDKKVAGSFWNDWWHGSFKAETCAGAGWTFGGGTTTTTDTGYY